MPLRRFGGGPILALVCAFLLGATVFAAGGLVVFRSLDRERRELRALHQQATDRLLSAWQAGVPIPSADVPDARPAPEALDEVVLDWLEQFDDAGRAHYGRKAKDLARAGRDGPTIVTTLNRLREAA